MNINMNDIIVKKRDGGKLTEREIREFVKEYTLGNIPDYQASALLMAIFFRHMDDEETFTLTDAMRASGDNVDLSAIKGIKVDKHSTGGVGDKVTLVAAPIASACGVPVAKMSGRGLGFTGGTIDKLESIPGFRTTLEPAEFFTQVNEAGIALIGQSGHIAPADKKLYALRDVTGTVENLSLIASSIMSKKLAAGSDAILLDVKCGSGAFMKDQKAAEELGEIMCRIGTAAGKKTAACITDMNQPLGRAVGNSLEVIEAIDTLKGEGPADITELSLHLAGIMIYLGGRAKTASAGRSLAEHAVASGAALARLRTLIERQGGDPDVIDDYSLFPQAKFEEKVLAESAGFVAAIDTQLIGAASQHTGAGRATKEDTIDHAAGVTVEKKIGERVTRGQTLAVFRSNDKKKAKAAADMARAAFSITLEKQTAPVLIKSTIGL